MPTPEENAVLDSDKEQAQSIEELGAELARSYQQDAPEGDAVDVSQEPEAVPSQAEPGAAESPGADDDPPEAVEQITAQALAEKLGMDVSDLYGSLQLDLGEGLNISLGDLKDHGKDLLRSEQMLAKAQDERATVEADLLQKNQALRLAMDSAGVEITPEQMQAAQAQTDQYKQMQDRIAVELMPDWAEESVRHEAEKQIDGLLDEYGYFPAEKPYMVDARLRKMFRDFSRLKAEVSDVANRKVTNSGKGQKPRPTTKVSDNVTDIRSKVATGALSQEQAARELNKLL